MQLTFVVSGKIELIRTAQGQSSHATPVIENVQRNGQFGVLEMLPLPSNGADRENLDLAKSFSSQMKAAHAREGSVICIQLERNRLAKIVQEYPELQANVSANVSKWVGQISQENRKRDWLLCAAAYRKAGLLPALQEHWRCVTRGTRRELAPPLLLRRRACTLIVPCSDGRRSVVSRGAASRRCPRERYSSTRSTRTRRSSCCAAWLPSRPYGATPRMT